MDLVFKKSYHTDTNEQDDFLMEVEVYSKQSKLSPGYTIDTIIIEIENTDGPFDYVVTGDVTDIEASVINEACDALWRLVIKGEDNGYNSKFLEPIAEILKGSGQYQKNTLGWRVLAE